MTIEEIQIALAELVAAMVEKNVSQPEAHLTIKQQGEKHHVFLTSAYISPEKNSCCKLCYGTTVAGAFKQARKDIAALPSPEEITTREYLDKPPVQWPFVIGWALLFVALMAFAFASSAVGGKAIEKALFYRVNSDGSWCDA